MKNIIKKILIESDDLDWIREIPTEIPLSTYMQRNKINIKYPGKLHGLKVRISPESRFYVEDDVANPIYAIGVIDVDHGFFGGDIDLPIIVRWDERLTNSYSVNDLLVVNNNIKESEDDLDWIRDVKPGPALGTVYHCEDCSITIFENLLLQIESTYSNAKWVSRSKPTQVDISILDGLNCIGLSLDGTISWDESLESFYPYMDEDYPNGVINLSTTINESQFDDFQWVKDIEPAVILDPNTVYCFNPPMNKAEAVSFAGRIENSEDLKDHLYGTTQSGFYNFDESGIKYFIIDDNLELSSWCTDTTCEQISERREYPIVDARKLFKL